MSPANAMPRLEVSTPAARMPSGDVAPVFIMGPHRSGTTILYKLLADTGQFNVTTAYHILNRHRLSELSAPAAAAAARAELAALLEARGLKDRDFDAVPVTPDIPEEYAYALDHQGRRPMLDRANLPGFLSFCRAAQAVQDPTRPLLLKNPFDAANFLFIARAFPRARFVFVHRHPAEVISSQIRAIRSILEQRNDYVALVSGRYRRLVERPLMMGLARRLYSDRWPLLVLQVSRNIARVNRYYVEHRGMLEDAVACDVSYPELCAGPAGVLARILASLGLPPPLARDYAAAIKPRPIALVPEVRQRLLRIEAQNAEYCRTVGV